MSALGQKRTYALQKAMSALPPIATAKADIRKPSCLLYPRKRTCAAHKLMSALGQKQTHALQQRTRSNAASTAGHGSGFREMICSGRQSDPMMHRLLVG